MSSVLRKYIQPFSDRPMRYLQGTGKKQYLLLLPIIIFGFVIRLWILDERWINPDEGAHIMDGRLVLDGLVPEVDYGSRQAVYVYIIAFILKVFGISYINVRFLPLISTLGICLFIFLISKRLFNDRIALLATAIYTFLPLSILDSVVVITEPLTTLFSCAGIYLALSGVLSERRAGVLFFLSGVFLGLAFYVRESSLAIPLALILFFVIAYWKRVRLLVRNCSIVLSGYISICALVIAFYSQFMAFSEIWKSHINPLGIIQKSLQFISTVFLAEAEMASTTLDLSTGFESWSGTIYYLDLTLFTHSFLLVAFLLSLIIFAYSLLIQRESDPSKRMLVSFCLLYSWVFSLAIAYLYWMFERGFFIQYFEEFLPPLTIILSVVINYSFSKLKLEKSLARNMGLVALCLLLVFFINRIVPDLNIKSITYLSVTTLTLAILYFNSMVRLQRWVWVVIPTGVALAVLLKLASIASSFIKVSLYLTLLALLYLAIFSTAGIKLRKDFEASLGFIALSLLLSSSVLSFAISGRSMGVAFDNGWSPETVKTTSDYIRLNSKPGDEVLSGVVIWELESDRRPFLNETHPLRFIPGISLKETIKIEEGLKKRPPRFIVLDGYTEKTYLKYIARLQEIMEERYELGKVVEGSRFPVAIYHLKSAGMMAMQELQG